MLARNLTSIWISPLSPSQTAFTNESGLMPTDAATWPYRRRHLTLEKVRDYQCKLGELRSLITAPCPDICARRAKLAAKENALQVC